MQCMLHPLTCAGIRIDGVRQGLSQCNRWRSLITIMLQVLSDVWDEEGICVFFAEELPADPLAMLTGYPNRHSRLGKSVHITIQPNWQYNLHLVARYMPT
jgi:hypothetical protein